MPRELTVSELNHLAAVCLAGSPELAQLLVEGEISAPKRYPSGHFYFSLKDARASVSCVMFASDVQRQQSLPEDGEKLICAGRVALYERDGRYQLYVRDFHRKGRGELWLQYEKLKNELAAKGWFDQSAKKKLPFLPQRVGVVTSEAGAVIHDIVNVARRRFPGFFLRLFPVRVQGAAAAAEIAAAIRLFNVRQAADVLIVGRGGGSMEDLACFNSPLLAEAVHASRIPIISAVGHESDVTICDFCADLRAPTPSAAAELCWPRRDLLEKNGQELLARLRQWRKLRFEAEEEQLSALRSTLNTVLSRRLREEELHLDALIARPALRSLLQSLSPRQEGLQRLSERLQAGAERRLEKESTAAALLGVKLKALSPWGPLERGFVAASDEKGHFLRSLTEIRENQILRLQFADGAANVRVLQRQPGERLPQLDKIAAKDGEI